MYWGCEIYGVGVLESESIGVLFYESRVFYGVMTHMAEINLFHFLFSLCSLSQFFLVLLFFHSVLDISIDQLQEFGKVFVTIRLGIIRVNMSVLQSQELLYVTLLYIVTKGN